MRQKTACPAVPVFDAERFVFRRSCAMGYALESWSGFHPAIERSAIILEKGIL
jgi:hypothetical protein|tara:strand:+ start:713 stop:871 length:159 start_codon:yes stop_codon:yes gene_type:complete